MDIVKYYKNNGIYKCHKCGKEFLCTDTSQWVYKLHRKLNVTNIQLYCCYTCYMAAKRAMVDKRYKRKGKKQ